MSYAPRAFERTVVERTVWNNWARRYRSSMAPGDKINRRQDQRHADADTVAQAREQLGAPVAGLDD